MGKNASVARVTPHGQMVSPVSISQFFFPISTEAGPSHVHDPLQTEAQLRREPALILWHAKILNRIEE